MSAHHHDSDCLTEDGLRLHQRDWTASHPRARLLLVHGLGEHCGRYERLAGELAEAGISVRGYDHRGHGRSPGERARIAPHGDQLARDLIRVHARYTAEGKDLPFVLGHSLGGLVAAYAVTLLGLKPRGLVLSSPALLTRASGIERGLTRFLSGVAPQLRLSSRLSATHLSHDRHVIDDYLHDPLNHRLISVRLAHFIFAAGPQAIAQAANLSVPTLLQFAADDHLVDPAGSRAFASAAPQRKLEVHEYLRLYHEIYNEAEPERSRVLADLVRWIELRLDHPKRPGHFA